MSFTVEILGEKWEVQIRKESEEKRLEGCDGFTDWTTRTIVVADRHDEGNLACPHAYICKVLRHEIIHAFFRESGIGECMNWGYSTDEMLVDWMAIQIPKISAVCHHAETKMTGLLYD